MKLYDKVVWVMTKIQNPSSDIVERDLRSFFTFYYLFIIETIPIFFFLIFEPFNRTTCFSTSCDD